MSVGALSGPILALDPAKHTGVAIGYPGDRPFLSVINLARDMEGPEDVFAHALTWIGHALSGDVVGSGGNAATDPPGLLAIEAPIAPASMLGSTRFETTLIALGLSAIFRGAARARGIPILLAPINSWRKYVLSRGNLKGRDAKAAMIRMCRGLGWGDDVPHDAAEAAGIFLWASGQINPRLATRPEPLFIGAGA